MDQFVNDHATRAQPTFLKSIRPEDLDWKPFAPFPPPA